MTEFAEFYCYPDWTANLRNIYWRLRASRNRAAMRRKYYRYIRKERDSLVAQGIPAEFVRLVCRSLSRPKDELALRRVEAMDMAFTAWRLAQGQAAIDVSIKRVRLPCDAPRRSRRPAYRPINLVRMIEAL